MTPRVLQLVLGLLLFGVAVALMVRSRLGLGPWDAFHQGVARISGVSLGSVIIVTGLAIVVGTLGMGIRPGAGTLLNMLLVGVFADAFLRVVPAASGHAWAWSYYLTAILLAGIGTGMYLAAGLGSGPRDGLMVSLADRSGWPVRRVRTAMEGLVLGVGWAMGARIGIGTLVFAVLAGPSVQWGMERFRVEVGTPARAVSSRPRSLSRRPRVRPWARDRSRG